jgi:hypothetical protein
MDSELALLAGQQAQQGSSAVSSTGTSALGTGGGGGDGAQAPQRAQHVLVGHSMGGAAVAEGVINNPEVGSLPSAANHSSNAWPSFPHSALNLLSKQW